jgi:hypothetical protein
MLKRSTVVTLIVLALVGGLYVYAQQPDNAFKKMMTAGSTATPEEFGTLISPDNQVSGFTLAKADGQTLSLHQEKGAWVVTAGYKDLANPDAADSAIRQVQALRALAKVDATTDLSAYGLAQPAYSLVINFNGAPPLTMKIGNQTVTKSGYYLLEESGEIVIVPPYGVDDLIALFDAPPFMNTATPSPIPATETPTATPTIIYTQTALPELTATKTP